MFELILATDKILMNHFNKWSLILKQK